MQITHTPQEQDMDIKAEVVGDTLKLVALNADADTWMGSNNFTPAGPACYTHQADELHQIMVCAGWVGLVVTQVDGPVFAADPLAPPVEDILLSNYGDLELHFRRSDGCYVITHPSHDRAVYEPDALDEACNSFASRAGCDPVVVLNEAIRLTEGA